MPVLAVLRDPRRLGGLAFVSLRVAVLVARFLAPRAQASFSRDDGAARRVPAR